MGAKKKTEIEQVEEQAEIIEPENIEVPEPVEEIENLPTTHIITAQVGDSYASIAAKYCPAGVKLREFSRDLFALNRGKTIRPGVTIIVEVA